MFWGLREIVLASLCISTHLIGGIWPNKMLTREEQLVQAIKEKNERRITLILHQDPDLFDAQPISVLHWAVNSGNTDILRLLLDYMQTKYLPEAREKCLKYCIKGLCCQAEMTHRYKVTSVSWSPDGSSILSTSLDDTARIWDSDGNLKATLSGQHRTLSAAWSPDGHFIATNDLHGWIRLWDSGGSLQRASDQHFIGWHTAWSPDGSMLMTAGDVIRIHNAQTWDYEDVYQTARVKTGSGAWNRESTHFITLCDGGIEIWHKKNDRWESRRIRLHKPFANAVDWSPDNKHILVGFADGVIQMRCPFGRNELQIAPWRGGVTAIQWDNDGQRFLAGSEDGYVRIWRFDGNCLYKGFLHSRITSVSWGSHERIVVGCENGKILVLDCGGSLIDWAARAISAGGEISLLTMLLACAELHELTGLIADTTLPLFCRYASKIKKAQPERYQELCSAIAQLVSKKGVSL